MFIGDPGNDDTELPVGRTFRDPIEGPGITLSSVGLPGDEHASVTVDRYTPNPDSDSPTPTCQMEGFDAG